MLRSLYAAVSGLENNQTEMDVIGNNIANVNTTGYKSQRVTFENSLSQLLQGATRPADGSGGTDPMQVGLGMSVGSIDTMLTQGNLQSTGQVTDLAIEGQAYFAVSDGKGTYYTRNGNFQLDANGNLVMPSTGMVVQGRLADAQGNISTASQPENIQIPFNVQSPAQATTQVNYARNLDPNSIAQGSVLTTQRFLNSARTDDNLQGLTSSTGTSLGIQPNDVLTFSMTNAAGNTVTQNFSVTANSTLGDLTGAMQAFLRANGAGNGTTVQTIDAATSATLRGGVTIFGNTADIQNLQVTDSSPAPEVTQALAVPTTIPAGTTALSVVTDTLRGPARAGTSVATSDPLSQLFDQNGNSLGLENGDVISVTGSVGGVAANNVPGLTYASGAGGTTMFDLLTNIRNNFKLPSTDGTLQNNPSVSIDGSGTDDNIPDGSIVIRGMPETAFALSNLQIQATNSNGQAPAPDNFNTNTNTTQIQAATDTQVADAAITVYDANGGQHTATMELTPTDTPNQWLWKMKMGGQEQVVQGGQGKLTFGPDGSVASFSFDDGSSSTVINPENGSANISLNLNVGGPGDFTGLTQFASATTAAAVSQNGYSTGQLSSISVGPNGVITGAFTNGTTKPLAQVLVADFNNPGGLQATKDSLYTTSADSGDPILGAPDSQSSSVIAPGALELSNVDLAQQFTDMITTQRGFQANARVITTSDQLLQELVSLKQ